MKSIILTAVNTVNLQFKDQVTELRGTGDIEFLKQFVSMKHKKADTVYHDQAIEVFTSKGTYIYRVYPKYIKRTDFSGKKIFYKIS